MNILPQTSTYALTAQAAEVRRAALWLHAEASARGVPEQPLGRLDLCLHEALANIIDHAGLSAQAPLSLHLQVQDACAVLTLRDGGRAFDPTVAPVREKLSMLETTMPGGLGLVMLRANADQLAYQREAEHNQLVISVRWSTA